MTTLSPVADHESGIVVCVPADLAPVEMPIAPIAINQPEPMTHAITDVDLSDRAAVIAAIRAALKRRSGKAWSVTGGQGTAYGWIAIEAPPRRRDAYGSMTDTDRAELAALLGLDSVHHQGENIPAAHDYRRMYIHRARYGTAGTYTATPYWD